MKKLLKFSLVLIMVLTFTGICKESYINAKEEQTVILKGEFCNDEALKQFEELNQYRKKNGVPELILDRDLSEYARKRAGELVVYFSHTRPNGSSVLNVKNEGLPIGYYGENAAYGYDTVEEVTLAWKKSAGHNTNMLKRNYISVGIGCFKYNNVKYWIQIYSDKINKEIIELPKNQIETIKIKNIMDYEVKRVDDIDLAAGKVKKAKIWASVNHGWAFYEMPLDNVIFGIDDSEIVKIDTKGNIYGLKNGKTTIIAKTLKGNYKFNVTVSSKYKIQYLVNGGTLHQYSPNEYSSTITLKEPTRKGYIFKGWYTGTGYKKKITKLKEGDARLYARWTKVEPPVTSAKSVLNEKTRKATFTISEKDVDGYQIYYSDNSSMKNPKKKLTVNPKLETESLKKGKTYYYKVRTFILDSTGTRVYGEFSSIKKIKVV